MIKTKLDKTEITRRVRNIIENNGGTFLRINWSKGNTHFLTPSNKKKVESLSFL